MVDFICKGYLELSGSRVEWELQNEKFLLTVEFEPGAFRLRSEGATTGLWGQMSVEGDKSSSGFNYDIFTNLPIAYGRCSNIICHELYSQSANFFIVQIAKRYKYNMTKIHDTLFCYMYI